MNIFLFFVKIKKKLNISFAFIKFYRKESNFYGEYTMDYEHNYFIKLVSGTVAFSVFFVALCVCTLVFIPAEKSAENTVASENAQSEPLQEQSVNYESIFDKEYPELVIETKSKDDAGLILYKQPQSRAAVEWYYSRVVNSREVAQAVLQSAEEFNIPLSLAFALAHTESNFKVTAMHKNTNGSIDRGLFQLNNTSFPKLEESDFYDPKTSAHYGLSHLRFCLNTAGNEIAALAMYNAGANKVRKNSTPQITLDYISKIQNYKRDLEDNFAVEVLALYNTETQKNLLAKKF